jgi:hypothetical protein
MERLMTKSKQSTWVAVVTGCVGVLLGLGLAGEFWGPAATGETGKSVPGLQQHTERLAKIEQAVTSLTHAVRHPAHAGVVPGRQVAATGSDERMLRQEVAQILREELRELHGCGEDSPSPMENAAANLLNTPENIEAYAQARAVAQTALSVGRWTDEEVHILRQAFAHLTDEQRKETLQLLIPAMNRGELAVETSGPPF